MKRVVVFYLWTSVKVTYFEPMHKILFPKCLSQGHTSCESKAYFLSKILLELSSQKLLNWMDNSFIISSNSDVFRLFKQFSLAQSENGDIWLGNAKYIYMVEREQLILKLSMYAWRFLQIIAFKLANTITPGLILWLSHRTTAQSRIIGFRFEQTNPKIIEFESHLIHVDDDNITAFFLL